MRVYRTVATIALSATAFLLPPGCNVSPTHDDRPCSVIVVSAAGRDVVCDLLRVTKDSSLERGSVVIRQVEMNLEWANMNVRDFIIVDDATIAIVEYGYVVLPAARREANAVREISFRSTAAVELLENMADAISGWAELPRQEITDPGPAWHRGRYVIVPCSGVISGVPGHEIAHHISIEPDFDYEIISYIVDEDCREAFGLISVEDDFRWLAGLPIASREQLGAVVANIILDGVFDAVLQGSADVDVGGL